MFKQWDKPDYFSTKALVSEHAQFSVGGKHLKRTNLAFIGQLQKKEHSITLKSKWVSQKIGFISFGFFLIVVGFIWLNTPGLKDAIVAFFEDFHLEEAFQNVYLPAPRSEWDHPIVYSSFQQFCIGYGIFQIVVLALRFAFGSSISDKAGTVSGIVFWLGLAYFTGLLLGEAVGWFAFLAGFIIVVGASIIVRGVAQILMRILHM